MLSYTDTLLLVWLVASTIVGGGLAWFYHIVTRHQVDDSIKPNIKRVL